MSKNSAAPQHGSAVSKPEPSLMTERQFKIALRRWQDADAEHDMGYVYVDLVAPGLDWDDAVNRVLVRPEYVGYSLWLVGPVSPQSGPEDDE